MDAAVVPMVARQIQHHFYGGTWRKPEVDATLTVVNPATEIEIGRVPSGTAADVNEAVICAREALGTWRLTPPRERASLLNRVGSILEREKYAIGASICYEVGTPIKLALLIQANLPIQSFQNIAKLTAELDFEETCGNSRICMVPAGVIAAITPWNYPLHQIAAKVAPALAAGCTVVLKPSELAPLTTAILVDAFIEAGFPPGVFNLVHGRGDEVGAALAAHPLVDFVSFTGSTEVGKALAREAASGIKRLSLELGGKSASVVLSDGELEAAVKSTIASCFLNSGQTCSALTRLIVPKSQLRQAEEIAEALAKTFIVGDPFAAGTRLGPLISARQRERVLHYVKNAERSAAKLVTGGSMIPRDLSVGFFVQPTVFSDVEPDSEIAQEEIFGPVLSIIAANDDADAIRIANASRYGLAAAVWSKDSDRAASAAADLEAGQVDINGGRFNPLAPFGGVKQSGYGRELGVHSIREFLVTKAIQT